MTSPTTATTPDDLKLPMDAEPLVPLPPFPEAWKSLGRLFIATARNRGNAPAMVDTTGASLSYRQVLLRALILGRVLNRLVGDSTNVGIMMPPTVAGAVANIALTFLGRVSVNLNYSANQEAIDSAVDQAEITHVITSQRVLNKLGLKPKGTLILLEDLAKQIGLLDKLWGAAVSTFVPTGLMSPLLPGLRDERQDRAATIIFTSGSTGTPKGVILTHGNIMGNAYQIPNHVDLTSKDVVLGVLPFFHSFGYTVSIWTAVGVGLKVVYHTSPLDSKIIARLAREHGATVLLATPTFTRSYLKKSTAEDFAKLRLLILGAEKLKPELADQIRSHWKVDPLEGYGCTETGPVVSVNVPHEIKAPDGRMIPGNRPGTIGRPLPGTVVKVMDLETGEPLPQGAEGMIYVKGPQVMSGYLNSPEATAEVLNDGWYQTGDIGKIDADGFIVITDRLSRFSKIGGEMVPHGLVESAILKAAGTSEQVAAVTSVPDSKRGERLAVLHTDELQMSPEEIVQRLIDEGLPKLWIPSRDTFMKIGELPVLGSGKLDLRQLRETARANLSDDH